MPATPNLIRAFVVIIIWPTGIFNLSDFAAYSCRAIRGMILNYEIIIVCLLEAARGD